MRTLRRLIYGEVIASVAFVTLGFLALFFFFDLVDEIRYVRGGDGDGYQLSHALLFVTLLLPNHLYELLPITVLIGTVIVMARLAQSSEYTILRTSGLGPWRALSMLLILGMGFVALTFATGDYLAPLANRWAPLARSALPMRASTGQSGAWLRERQPDHSYAVNVKGMSAQQGMTGLRLFQFTPKGYISATAQAESAQFTGQGQWLLRNVQITRFVRDAAEHHVEHISLPEWTWPNSISAEMVSVALLNPERMRTLDLFQYIRHLNANGQTAQRYEIAFWRKVFYPLSCLVMVVLALPFAYLHFRAGGISSYVFAGVMIGISFFLLNNVFSYAGNLQNWSPWLTSAAPGLIYTLFSLSAFGWLVLRR